jgi:hypothetical protein
MSTNARPPRPVKPTDRPIYYRLLAELLAVGMTDLTPEGGFDIYEVNADSDPITYMVAIDDGFGLPVIGVKRTVARGELVPLATFWDTTVDGSTLPEAVDVRTR